MPVDFKKLELLRGLAGLSQEAAGEGAQLGKGVTARVRWNTIVKGKKPDLRISTLEAVARLFGCQVQDLLTAAPAKPQKRKRPSAATGSKA